MRARWNRALSLDETGAGWALATLAAGAAGPTLAIEAGRRQAMPPADGEHNDAG